MRAYRVLTHIFVLLVTVAIAGYSSIGRHAPTLRLGAQNADALITNQGGTVGGIALGRQGTILKPVAIPSSAPESHQPIEYTVISGESLQSVASKFKLLPDNLCASNPGAADAVWLKPGSKVVVPPVPGIVMTARGGDTADKIARSCQVGLDSILDFNYLRSPLQIVDGMRLVLPGGKGRRCPAVGGLPQGPPSSTSAGLSGPAGCPIRNYSMTQPFGPSRFEGFHAGIDLAAAFGAPIYAVADGVATVNRGGYGYGNHIMIKVSDQRTDLYGHLSQILVSPGQAVKAGDLIGREGSTGFSTGPHLHYEVRIGGVATDPASLIHC
ncbi:MAG: peptidoglycan DD-metalloendopeptidase family protein [Candidatus Dormibacteraeota bacterium]|nr:peptidoglycan DD-metalloendopeptidase family protein [Candidatus Dormibacteraeota bacterium]